MAKKHWPRRIAITGAVLLIYVLSIGPLMRLVDMQDASEDDGMSRGQVVVSFIYIPLGFAAVICPPFRWFLIRYMDFWGVPLFDAGDPSPNPA
jgi:hypothetical protein